MRCTARPWAWCLVALAVFASGCGSPSPSVPALNAPEASVPGDIPDSQVFVRYSPPSGDYSLKYPEGWAVKTAGGTTTFTRNYNQLTVHVAHRAARPTLAGVTETEIPKLRTQAGFKLHKVETVKRAAGNAVRIVYEATSAPDVVTGKSVALDVERYLFWRRGTLVTIALSSPKGSDNVDAWRTVTNSLAWA